MLKLNASYSKKVPAEGEYSSQSYHASIEVEFPDGLSQEQLNDKIHETFAMVRDSVEAELLLDRRSSEAGKESEAGTKSASGAETCEEFTAETGAERVVKIGLNPLHFVTSVTVSTSPLKVNFTS